MFKIENNKVWYYNIGLLWEMFSHASWAWENCIKLDGTLSHASWAWENYIKLGGTLTKMVMIYFYYRLMISWRYQCLAIRAHVRCVQEVLQGEEADVVRAVIQLNETFNLEQFNRWQTTTDGVPYLLTKRSRFADRGPVFGGLWSYRSTV